MNPVVFISYSHDTAAHKARVLELSNRLRADGVDTVLDQYVNGSPPEKWPRWMLNGLERATHVLCVCSETYYRRFRGHEVPGQGRGVDWEGAIITQELYDSRSHSAKFIPLLFDGGLEKHIPEPLRGATHYRLTDGYEALYDAILAQAGVEPPALGPLRRKPRGPGVTGAPPPQPNPPEAASPEPSREELDVVFAETVEALESAITAAPAVARFLGTQAPPHAKFVAQQAGQWAVLAKFRTGGGDVAPVLTSMWQRRATFAAPRHEWDALEQVIGGILVLGIDPRWVWQQRQSYASRAAHYPNRAGEVTVEAGKAQFLSLLATALAKGCARLDRIFGQLDSKRLPDMAGVLPGIIAADRIAEMKRHFIRYVIGPSDEWDVDALEGAALDTFFKRVRQILHVACRVDRDPFYAAGPNLTRLAAEVKQHLELSDLFLFVPAESGDESDLMTDPVVALMLAQRLRKHIESNRPNL